MGDERARGRERLGQRLALHAEAGVDREHGAVVDAGRPERGHVDVLDGLAVLGHVDRAARRDQARRQVDDEAALRERQPTDRRRLQRLASRERAPGGRRGDGCDQDREEDASHRPSPPFCQPFCSAFAP
jgi:hypothetical protein